MVVQESNLEEDMQETTYEEEETLSLSDLPSYSHAEWEEEEVLSSSDQDYFEFNFSQELSPSAAATAASLSLPENVVFCGKLIPYKQPSHVSDHKDSSRTYESVKKQVADGKKNRRGGGSTRRIDQSKNGNRKDHCVQSSLQGWSNFRLCEMSMVTSSSSGKARWYPFLFGIRRFPTKMELRDIRSRQSRRQHCSPPPSPLLSSSRDQVVSQGRNSGWGFWSVIRALSCGGNHQTETSVTPFIGCTSPE